MAVTPSSMLPLGTIAPDFSLENTIDQRQVSLQQVKGPKGTVVMFICNHCPYVIHILDKVLEVVKHYQAQGINFIAISANDIENYPQDAPDKMQQLAQQKQFSFPYLYDETQEVAKAYQAACTPDLFVFDKDLKCVYRGRFDGATPGNGVAVTGDDLKAALDNLLKGATIDSEQRPSMGCNIKWKV